MAIEGPQISIPGLKAGADLRTKQYYFVKITASGTVGVPTASTDVPVGVLQNTPNTNDPADVMCIGETKLAIAGTAATGVLTSDNTIVTTADTVTIGTIVYTFRTTLTPANYEVLAVTDADTSLGNLAHAINGTGGVPGTDYVVPAAHPTVSSGAVVSHAITLTARTAGTAGNGIATTETSSHLSFGGALLTGGLGVSAGGFVSTGSTGLAITAVAGTDTTHYMSGQIIDPAANGTELATAFVDCSAPHRAA